MVWASKKDYRFVVKVTGMRNFVMQQIVHTDRLCVSGKLKKNNGLGVKRMMWAFELLSAEIFSSISLVSDERSL